MKLAPLPQNEQERLLELQKYNILDTEPEEVLIALFNSLIIFVKHRLLLLVLWMKQDNGFKASIGLDANKHERYCICAHAILQEEPFIIEDA